MLGVGQHPVHPPDRSRTRAARKSVRTVFGGLPTLGSGHKWSTTKVIGLLRYIPLWGIGFQADTPHRQGSDLG